MEEAAEDCPSPVRDITENTFDVTVTVSVSNTFFAWMAGFMGDMTITGPPEVREEYRKMLQQGLEDLEAAERESTG